MCSFKCVSTVDKLPVEQIVVKNEKRHGNMLVHSHSQFPRMFTYLLGPIMTTAIRLIVCF